MNTINQNVIIEKAREIGIKFNKQAELDFGAGAEWMQEQLLKANPLDCVVSDAKGRKIKGIQILAYEINTLSGDIDVAYCKKFKEMTIDFIGGDNTILTKKDLEALLSR